MADDERHVVGDEVGVTEEPMSSSESKSPRAGVLIGLLVGLLGFGLAVQLNSGQDDPSLSGARQEDLVRILADIESRKERLQDEITSLEDRKQQLTSNAQGPAAAAEARRLADELGILAGTLPAEGPGLLTVFRPGSEAVRADQVLNAVEELRGAGAEAMQISGSDGAAVRVVADTYFVDHRDGLEVDGRVLTAPYTLRVIGDPETMRTALEIPGGVVSEVSKDGGTVSLDERRRITVSALRRAEPPRYARPAS